MKILFLKYNKPTNDAFTKFMHIMRDKVSCIIADLREDFGQKIDFVDFNSINKYLNKFRPFDAIFIGDIFWITGQNICCWANINNIKCCFLQHGQWIYIQNKMNPTYAPSHICVYGNNVVSMSSCWPLAKNSSIIATGSPRYDILPTETVEDAVYFSPPVLIEVHHSGRKSVVSGVKNWLHDLRQFDKYCKVYLQTHYRDAPESDMILQEFFPYATFIDRSDDPLRWIAKCQKVVTHRNSTTVLDAIASKKPVILINIDDESSFFPNGYFGDFTKEISNVNDLITHVMSKIEFSENSTDDHIITDNSSVRIFSAIHGV